MVEYGGGIEQGPAGQVSGGGGGGGETDLMAPVGRFVDDAVQTLSTLSPMEVVIVVAAVFFGLLLLRRAF